MTLRSLPLFVRLDGRPVILLGEGEPAAAKGRLLARAGAVPVGEAADAALAIVAIEDEAEALAAIARLKARGVLVNAVDRPSQCDFTLPAIVDRDPVIVAIGIADRSAPADDDGTDTKGDDSGLARWAAEFGELDGWRRKYYY